MRGWRYEGWRHSLAAKGIKSWKTKYPELVKPFPGENPRITDDFARFRQNDPSKYSEFRTKKLSSGKELVMGRKEGSDKWEVQSILIPKRNFAVRSVIKKGKLRRTMSGPEVISLSKKVAKDLEPLSEKIEVAGSIRRKVPDPFDVDIVLVPKSKSEVLEKLESMGKVTAKGNTMVETKIEGVDVDTYFATKDDFGAQMMTRTGPWQGNLGNRTLAKNRGMKLNQYGLWKGNRRIAGRTEKEIYEALGKKYKEPELRGR